MKVQSHCDVSSSTVLLRAERQGDDGDGRVDWAQRRGALAMGASFSYSESDTSLRSSRVVFADTERRTSLGRLGVEWQPARRWLVGFPGEFAYAPTRTNFLIPMPIGLVSSQARDITRQIVVRPGIVSEWRDHALIHLDYQYGRFWSDTGSLDVSRFKFGGDLPLARFLFVRAGAMIDTRGDFGWTAGFGFYPRKGLTFDFAYQNDAFP